MTPFENPGWLAVNLAGFCTYFPKLGNLLVGREDPKLIRSSVLEEGY